MNRLRIFLSSVQKEFAEERTALREYLQNVLSKIDCAVGTRTNGPQAPVEYEIPPEVVSEAIVNAVAHRDYSSNGSGRVMLFSDRCRVAGLQEPEFESPMPLWLLFVVSRKGLS